MSTHAEPSAPLAPQVGVIALVPDRWGNHWSSRHHVLSRLSRFFHVVWVNPTHDRHQILERARGPRSFVPVPQVGDGFVVYTPPFWLPKLYQFPTLEQQLLKQRLNAAERELRRRGCDRIVLYLWRPAFAAAVGATAVDLVCYHIDDEYSFGDVEVPTPAVERDLINAADQVIVHSPGLMDKKGCLNPNTALIPLGVEYERFADLQPEPLDYSGIPRPRIGYTGHLKKDLDWNLLLHLARSHPQWSFVFVGGQEPHPEIVEPIRLMSALPNVYFLGPRPTSEIAPYIQHLDVCLLPYQTTAYTQYVYPLKVHEYLAAGKPTVGTPIRSLQLLGDVVELPHSTEEWSEAIAHALESGPQSPVHTRRRQAVAQQHDWAVLVRRIAGLIAQSLDEPLSDQVQQQEDFNYRTTTADRGEALRACLLAGSALPAPDTQI